MNGSEPHLVQSPAPGRRMIGHRGDVVAIRLQTPADWRGAAYLRTTLGRAAQRREEVVRAVEQNVPALARGWHDVPMTAHGDGVHSVRMPLDQTGRFEAKAFWLAAADASPLWPAGGNLVYKVEPSETVCANTIYTAFVRQFGPNKARRGRADEAGICALEQAGYAVIPASGGFRDLARELDFVIGEIGFRIVHLLPVHPVPTTYARMGRFGSPFAALDYMDVDSALSEFDRRTTPMEQFDELADAIHARGAWVFLDIPVNHTGWGSRLQNEHPEWFVRDARQGFRSPGAWGVVWKDLAELDYRRRDLWMHMAQVFLFWCRRGVDGFRCDAGYKLPYAAWEYIVARVRSEFPDTVFFLEGLGGKISVMESLLDGGNMNWAYSELFQNYDRAQIESYLPGCIETSRTCGSQIHFAETHDNNRLAARSERYARLRVVLCALLSDKGGFGIANGVEWLATEKIDVHGAAALNWGAEPNLAPLLRRLNWLLRTHPCFGPGTRLRLVQGHESGNVVAVRRETDEQSLLVLVNLSEEQEQTVVWSATDFPVAAALTDLVTGDAVAVENDGARVRYRLAPAEARCLCSRAQDRTWIESRAAAPRGVPDRIRLQQRRAQILDLCARATGLPDAAELDAWTRDLGVDARAFYRDASVASRLGRTAPVAATWVWPRDTKRQAMLPPGMFLHVLAPHAFEVRLCDGDTVRLQRRGVRDERGHYAALLPPPPGAGRAARSCRLRLRVHAPDGTRHCSAPLLCLGAPERVRTRKSYDRPAARTGGVYAALGNEIGTLAQARADWGRIESQYDALLAANLNPAFPSDRQTLLTRCRVWLLYRGHWQTLGGACVRRFTVPDTRSALWRFVVPVSGDWTVAVEARLLLAAGHNAIRLEFRRVPGPARDRWLPQSEPIELIVRPDIEDRVSHAKTKAYTGLEEPWRAALHPQAAGFEFRPAPGRSLSVQVSSGAFVSEPEWLYGVAHPFEAQRGLDDRSDLFSPGYFSLTLAGSEQATLTARAQAGEFGPEHAPSFRFDEKAARRRTVALDAGLRAAMDVFLVRRGRGRTVLAGLPWFLDWGRDTLIALRGMIAADRMDDARSILIEFARFEEQGTLPNMIHGATPSNRDTSDAPLWFLVACADALRRQGADSFLEADCGGRPLRDILFSIGRHCRDGTPNGIGMDPESGLLFSPSHFTWMDTNHPAGTPREGYPIEIQALWHAGLQALARLDANGPWADLAAQARRSVLDLFPVDVGAGLTAERCLSDCLHAGPGVPAAQARADDAVRPNQLLALTLAGGRARAGSGRAGGLRRIAGAGRDPQSGGSAGDDAVARSRPSWTPERSAPALLGRVRGRRGYPAQTGLS